MTKREDNEPRRRILVVDDEPFVLKATVVILRREHEVLTARSGEEALRRLQQDSGVDVILCDLTMRGVSGIDLYEKLRIESPEIARRIVFMTGGAVTQHAMDFLEAVPNRCIEKPFEPEQLLAVVEETAA